MRILKGQAICRSVLLCTFDILSDFDIRNSGLKQGFLYRNSRREAGRAGQALAAGFIAGPDTVRLPTDVAQRAQRNSCNSPEGSTSNSFSRTGWEERHFGQ